MLLLISVVMYTTRQIAMRNLSFLSPEYASFLQECPILSSTGTVADIVAAFVSIPRQILWLLTTVTALTDGCSVICRPSMKTQVGNTEICTIVASKAFVAPIKIVTVLAMLYVPVKKTFEFSPAAESASMWMVVAAVQVRGPPTLGA